MRALRFFTRFQWIAPASETSQFFARNPLEPEGSKNSTCVRKTLSADLRAIKNSKGIVMGKHSNFERKKDDFYPTPYEAVPALLPHLFEFVTPGNPLPLFVEPCAGDGRLIRHLESHGFHCVYACDLEPKAEGIEQKDVLFFDAALPACDLIITNPPWERDAFHAMIDKFSGHAPTWLLADADWAHTVQAAPFMQDCCVKIVSVGRISWEGNDVSGKDNCCWYYFRKDHVGRPVFYGRDGQ